MKDSKEKETKPACQELYAIEQGKYLIWYQQADKGTDAGAGQAGAYCFLEPISAALEQKHEYEFYGNIRYNRA